MGETGEPRASEASSQGTQPAVVRRHKGLVGRTALVSLLTLVSRLLGFVREMITATIFGDTSSVCDAFFTAWRVPNLFRRLFGEGALSTSLQAELTEADADQGVEAGRRLFVRTLVVASLGLSVLSVVGMLAVSAMPDRMPLTGWPWFGADAAPVRDLTVRLFPYVLLVCVAALCGGALQVRGHFSTPNASPAVMNVVWIAGLLVVALVFASADRSDEGVQWEMARWVAWGVLAGGVLQLAILVPPMLSHGLLRRRGGEIPGAARPKNSVGRVLRTSLPLALGAAVYQVNVLIDGLMAEGLLRDGGPTALYYANRIQQFPLALVATATITAVFPSLKAHAHLGETGVVRDLHARAQLGILFLALPAAIGLWVLAAPVAEALFLRGNYGPDGTARIAGALRMLALALVPAGASGFCGRTFIALGDYRTPVLVAVVFLVANALLNVGLVLGLGLDVEGLALATALTSWGSFAWLYVLLRHRLGPAMGAGEALRRILGIAAAAIACGLAALAVKASLDGGYTPWLVVGGGAAAGVSVFFLTARLLGLEEWRDFSERLARRMSRARGGR